MPKLPADGQKQILPPVAGPGKTGELNELAPDDGFNPIGGFATAFLLEVTPDLCQVAVRLQLWEAAQAEQESVEGRQERGSGGDLGVLARVAPIGEPAAKIEDRVEVAGEGRESMAGDVLPSIKCNNNSTQKQFFRSLLVTAGLSCSARAGAIRG